DEVSPRLVGEPAETRIVVGARSEQLRQSAGTLRQRFARGACCCAGGHSYCAAFANRASSSSVFHVASRSAAGRPKITRSTPAHSHPSMVARSAGAQKTVIEIERGSRPAFFARSSRS